MKKNAVIGKAKVSNRPNLNAFDLSHRNLFTSYLGAILPVHVMELMPGDTVQVSPNWFTRAMDLQANAYGRLIENVQTFFVPYSSLWKNIQYNMLSTLQKGASGFPESRVATDVITSLSTSTKLPRMKLKGLLLFCWLVEYLVSRVVDLSQGSTVKPTVALRVPFVTYSQELRSVSIARLASYLGYGGFDFFLNRDNRDYSRGGNMTFVVNGVSTTVTLHPISGSLLGPFEGAIKSGGYGSNVFVNPLRWFAYHFVYNNFYRNDTWQPYQASTCNLDWLKPNDPYIDIMSETDEINAYQALKDAKTIDALFTAWNTHMTKFADYMFFDLRESNLLMDAYNGVLPNPQYGSTSTVAPLTASSLDGHPNIPLEGSEYTDGKQYFKIDGHIGEKAGVDIFDLRQSIAMQKFLEISQSHDSSYKEQIKAHFGVDTADDPYKAYFIGGSSSTMQVDTQVHANLAGDNSAVLGGIASAQGNYSAKYKSDTYGILISLYRIIPIIDYQDRGIKDQILTVDSTDLPVPEFDSIGMERRRNVSVRGFDSSENSQETLEALKTYGYAARYLDYKTDVDKIHGEFKYTLKNRVIATPKNLYKSGSGVISSLLRVYPSMVDQIFVNNNHGLLSDDQFYTNMNVSVTAVRPLSVHGMPYAN